MSGTVKEKKKKMFKQKRTKDRNLLGNETIRFMIFIQKPTIYLIKT